MQKIREMLLMAIKMKAPKGTTTATIEGNEYKIPKSGIIDVTNEGHIDTLKRHGFTEHFEEPADLDALIDAWTADDKDEAVEFIEERGGTADNDMGLKKLKRLAREAAGLEAE